MDGIISERQTDGSDVIRRSGRATADEIREWRLWKKVYD